LGREVREGRVTQSGVERVAIQAADMPLDELLDVSQVGSLLFAAEGDGDARGSGAAGTADAVDVGFGLVGHFEVEDVGDVLHVDASGSDVRGNEHGAFATFEAVEGTGACVL